MARQRKEKRNKEIVEKKRSGWSFRNIAQHYNISVRAVWEIYKRDAVQAGQEAVLRIKPKAVANR